MLSFTQFITEGPLNPFFKNNKKDAAFNKKLAADQFAPGNEKKTIQIIKDYMNQYGKKFEQIRMKLEKIAKGNLGNNKVRAGVKILSRLKSGKSIHDKAVKRGKGMLGIGDFIAGAVLLPTLDDAREYVKDFRRKQRGIIVAYEEKTKPEAGEFGYYGSHHLDLLIDGVYVELQIMTKKLWKFKEVGHEIYTDTRSKKGGPSAAEKTKSRKIFGQGNQPTNRFEECVDLTEWVEADLTDIFELNE